MIKIVIVDDDMEFANTLKAEIIDLMCNCEVACFVNSKEVSDEYDVYFLDVELGVNDINGFVLAQNIKENHHEKIIVFISSHDEFICEGYKFSALRYLRKSKYKEELLETMEAIKDKINQLKRVIKVNYQGVPVNLSLNDIQYFYSSGNYLILIDKDGKEYKLRDTIKHFVDRNQLAFIMPSSRYFVNPIYIKDIDIEGLMIRMSDQNKIDISQRNLSKVIRSYVLSRR